MVGCGQGPEDRWKIRERKFSWNVWFRGVESLGGQANEKATKVNTDTKEPTCLEAPKSHHRRSWDGLDEQTSRLRRSRSTEPDESRNMSKAWRCQKEPTTRIDKDRHNVRPSNWAWGGALSRQAQVDPIQLSEQVQSKNDEKLFNLEVAWCLSRGLMSLSSYISL